ncbi:MAG: hypothetical protein JWQ73_3715 [Variovorax sp.]|jgi:hypothetical protein|nr:hypothetical protein [Variovorax sp.]
MTMAPLPDSASIGAQARAIGNGPTVLTAVVFMKSKSA